MLSRCSRLGGRRIVFQPYTQQQLVEIVQTRLEGLNVFEPSAIRFAAAKVGASATCPAARKNTSLAIDSACILQVASVSGDIRRGLELCIRAVEIAEAEYKCAAQSRASLTCCLQQTTTESPLTSLAVYSHSPGAARFDCS